MLSFTQFPVHKKQEDSGYFQTIPYPQQEKGVREGWQCWKQEEPFLTNSDPIHTLDVRSGVTADDVMEQIPSTAQINTGYI